MIAPHDYVGQDFAWFGIEKHIGSGAEAEVYLCRHVPTQRSYVLRLPAEDDSLWERDGPLLPPVNSLIEHRNAIGSAHAGLTRDGLKMVVKGQEFSFSVVQLYGVRDGRYLLPVSNNWSRRGALSFGAVLDVSPSLPGTLPFWEMLQHLLVVDCHFLDQDRLNEAEWRGRWDTLLAHSSSLDGGLQFAEYSPRARSLIDACGAGSSGMDGPTLEESAVMRIIYGVLAGRFTLDQIEASLSCPFFRLNITVHDIQYALCLLRLYQEVDWVESVARMLGPAPLQPLLTLLDGFTRQPLDHRADPGIRERCSAPPRDAGAVPADRARSRVRQSALCRPGESRELSYFWYISRTKVDLLSEQYGRGILETFKELALKLKSPVVDAEFRFANASPGLVTEVRRLEGRIAADVEPLDFECLNGEEDLPPFFYFSTPGARSVSDQEFWVAGHVDGVALLLVGAARHVPGTFTSTSALSPSMNPLRAIREKAEGESRPMHDLAAASSYAWQAIMRADGQNRVTLPTVSGIAATVAIVDARRQQTRRAGIDGIERIVVGTPLFVEQI